MEFDNEDDGYASCSEIDFEITDNNNTHIQTISVPYRPTFCNKKRLICFSVMSDSTCIYDTKCTYAHSLDEQVIDEEKFFIYQIILDKDLMNFISMTNPKTEENFKQLLLFTKVCEKCSNNKCTGGFNCRNGVCLSSLKICKNDLLTGQCSNPVYSITIDDNILNKFGKNEFHRCSNYLGCMNGHHLTTRGLIPYYKYTHSKENSKKNKYQSVRYIDINPLNRVFNNTTSDTIDSSSDSSTDDEISSWFAKKYDSDSDSDKN